MIADSMNKDHGYMDTIKTWYVYDNNNKFDEKREEESFKGEYEFLKEDIEQALSTLKSSHDISVESEWKDDNIELFYILDRKTRKGNYYKLNYQTGIFEQAVKEEWSN